MTTTTEIDPLDAEMLLLDTNEACTGWGVPWIRHEDDLKKKVIAEKDCIRLHLVLRLMAKATRTRLMTRPDATFSLLQVDLIGPGGQPATAMFRVVNR